MCQTGTRHYTKKQWGIALIVIVAVIAIAIALADNPPQSVASVETQSSTLVPSKSGDRRITSSQYNQIKSGMSYDQVKQIIGSEGQNIFESGDKGTGSYQISYMWTGADGGEATISFTGKDKLVVQMKSQSGLK